MDPLSDRLQQALRQQEIHAENIANVARLILLVVFGALVLVNARAVSLTASLINFSALLFVSSYGLLIFLWLRKTGYRPAMKYVTSLTDISCLYIVLFLYALIDMPSVALKNYLFLAVFPLIALTIFRFDPKLTWFAGGWAILLYVILFMTVVPRTGIEMGSYDLELFTPVITYIGQLTKLLILCGFVVLSAYLTRYSRSVIHSTVLSEVTLQLEKETIERELTLASEVQKRLLPSSLPKIELLDVFGTVVQGTYVGGDYYDVIKRGDSSILLVLADVSGKGMPAALIMSQVRASAQLSAASHAPLDQIVTQLNILLHKSTSPKEFVTFFIAELDLSKGMISYVNAGHPPPFLQLKGELTRLAKGTVPLGVVHELPSTAIQSTALLPESMIVGYTDGIVERMNEAGEEYGEQRLCQFIKQHTDLEAREFVEALIQDVRNFDDQRGLDDDATVIVVRYG